MKIVQGGKRFIAGFVTLPCQGSLRGLTLVVISTASPVTFPLKPQARPAGESKQTVSHAGRVRRSEAVASRTGNTDRGQGKVKSTI